MSERKTVRFKGLVTLKEKPKQRFKRLAKFIVVLFRSWKLHAHKVRKMLDQHQTLHLIADSTERTNLLFDITEYRTNREARTSSEAKRILQKRSRDRTSDELHFVQIVLSNYSTIAEYPVHMQKCIAARAWYQGLEAKRVIVREGHVPMQFYFILSGSAVVTLTDVENEERTAYFLGRGDSFGDEEIVNKTTRPNSVISKERLELLVLTNEDFINIFMSGGVSNLNEDVLRSIPCLSGWPRHLLRSNPKKATLTFFKRRSVVVKESRDSEWIVIVISGSCNLLKKLKQVSPKKKRIICRMEDWREKVVRDLQKEPYLSHEERLQVAYQKQIQHLQEMNQRMRYYALPEINMASTEEYQDMKRQHSQTPFITSSRTDAVTPDEVWKWNGDPEVRKSRQQVANDNRTRTVSFTSDITHKEETTSEEKTVFINVRTLTKGSVFGISDVFFPEQPSFSLISNGAECLLVSKKLFLDNASHDFLVQLRSETLPYPSEEDLQRNLEDHVMWNHHKKQTLSGVMKEIRERHPRVKFPWLRKRFECCSRN